MEKLVEREPAQRRSPLSTAPALAVQFFLIPLAVVAVVVLVYGGFRLILTSERTPEEFLTDVRSGGRERRWPAAYELSRMLADDPDIEVQHPELGAAIVGVFRDLTQAARAEGFEPTGWGLWTEDDARVRRYLALAIGRLHMPPPSAADELVNALDDPDAETRINVIWALASIGDGSVVSAVEALYESADAGVRKMAVYALGALPAGSDLATLRKALEDPVPDVQWNAAVALARHESPDGVPVLRRMLNREYVTRMVSRTPTAEATIDPVSEVIVTGLQAVATLQAEALRPEIEALSQQDVSLRVREVALKALDALAAARTEPSAALSRR